MAINQASNVFFKIIVKNHGYAQNNITIIMEVKQMNIFFIFLKKF